MSLIDEYEAQNSFGWGRGLSALFTGGLSEVYNLSASAVSQAAAAELELANAESSAVNANIASQKLTRVASKKITKTDFKSKSQDLSRFAERFDPSVDDLEEHSSSWYNIGGHIGEAYANSRLRDSKKRSRKQESKQFITEVIEQISNNVWLPDQQSKDLMVLLEICIKEQGYLNRHPWGVAVFGAIRSLSNYKGFKTGDELYKRYEQASKLVNSGREPDSVEEKALKYVWSKCKLTLADMKAHIDAVDAEVKEKERREQAAAAAKQQEERRRVSDRNVKIVDESTTIAENKGIENIDDIFKGAKELGVVVSKAYETAYTIFMNYLSDHDKKWPDTGIYEYGNAVFCIVSIPVKKKPFNFVEGKKTVADKISAFVKDRYNAEMSYTSTIETSSNGINELMLSWSCKQKDTSKHVSTKVLKEEYLIEAGIYRYAVAFKKTDIVPAPVVTKVDTATVRAAAPQGAVKKPPVPEKGKGPDVVKPNPLPESVKPKTKAYKPREDRKPVMAGKILLPYPDETKEEYEARFKYEYERWMAKYAEPIISYYTDFGKKAAVKWRNLQKANGLEPSGFFVPTKDGYEVYAVDPKTVPQKTEETPKEEAATPTPESAKQPAPEVKPTSMERPPAVDEPKKAPKEEQDWKAMFESQQGELNALKAMISGENPTANLLKQLVELQTKNNELTEANGDAQKAQTDVFGRNLALLGKQKPQVVIMPATGEQSKAYTPPDTPLNIRQSV